MQAANEALVAVRATLEEDVPIDVLGKRLGSSRRAIYMTPHEARAKLRRVLADAEYEESVA